MRTIFESYQVFFYLNHAQLPRHADPRASFIAQTDTSEESEIVYVGVFVFSGRCGV